MKLPVTLLMAFCFPAIHLLGNEDIYCRTQWIDGLPLRLAEHDLAEANATPGTKTIDLSDLCKKSGISIPQGGSVLYHTGSGALISNLDHKNQEMLDSLIGLLYCGENLLAMCRAYHDLLAPLSAGERLKKVTQIGYVPDPMIATLIDRLRTLNDLRRDPDPFDPNPKPPKQFTEKDIQQIKTLEKQITALLEISLQRLKQQLAVLDEATPQPPPSKQP
jgi:hypothetical protein